ncbi:hypothetical protein AYI69_g19 [Smittium culicis]|uniref:Uncharacterized protein n=1 Tax=Smittium culicis TaxID=133412 RepID=A0A1R1YU62_9FUNG|nr:hypothetical protein AYI69_g19 [Smittium culicis]
MEESYRSRMGTPGDQGRVPNILRCASSHDQAAKAVDERLIETSVKVKLPMNHKQSIIHLVIEIKIRQMSFSIPKKKLWDLTREASRLISGENLPSSSQTREKENFEAQECYPADHAGLEHASIFGPSSPRKPDLVERSPQEKKKSELSTRDLGSGSLHRYERLTFEDSHSPEPVLRNMSKAQLNLQINAKVLLVIYKAIKMAQIKGRSVAVYFD